MGVVEDIPREEIWAALGKMDNIIIDTHMSIKSPAGYLPGLPAWVLTELMVSSYFLIESTPEEIMLLSLDDCQDCIYTLLWHRNIQSRQLHSTCLPAGAHLVFLMDEVVSKYGIGSGISLFIAAGDICLLHPSHVHVLWATLSYYSGNMPL